MTPTPPAADLQPTELVTLDVDPVAVLDRRLHPVPQGGGPRHAQLRYDSTDWRVRSVGSFGLDRPAGGAGPVAEPIDEQAEASLHPARLVVTDRRLVAVARDGQVWEAPFDRIVEVLHSATEPCSAFLTTAAEFAVVVQPGSADRLRAAIDAGLAHSDQRTATGPGSPLPPPSPDQRPTAARVRRTTVRSDEDRSTAPALHARRQLVVHPALGDRLFRGMAWGGGLSVLAIMVTVGLFLTLRALPALRATGLRFLTTEEWQPDIHRFGIAAVLFFTVAIATVALIVAVPLATGTALFITEIAPRRFKQFCIAMVDLMAAVPSIVYGLWGLFFLQGHVIGLARWLSTWFSWLPLFKVSGASPTDPLASQSVYTASSFIAGIVVAMMVIPITCSIMREVFSQAPPGEREGAYALGATRWGMVRAVVLPFGRAGMIGAIMLGLGRALGETIAVYLIISPKFLINWHILQSGSNSVASLIVLRQGDASGFGLSALMSAGLALFTLTLIVNFVASAMVARSRSGAQSDA